METKELPFYTHSGFLTEYGLSCGYIEKQDEHGIRTTMWKEHNAYHVRQHNHNDNVRMFWDTFDTLMEARKRYIETTSENYYDNLFLT